MDIYIKSTFLFDKVKSTIDECFSAINEYSYTFKQEYFFTFSDTDQKLKIYTDEYRKFRSVLLDRFNFLGDCAAQISSLLLDADRLGDLENIQRLKAVFESYLLLEKSFYEYSKAVEVALSKDAPSISVIMQNLSRLKLSFESLYEML